MYKTETRKTDKNKLNHDPLEYDSHKETMEKNKHKKRNRESIKYFPALYPFFMHIHANKPEGIKLITHAKPAVIYASILEVSSKVYVNGNNSVAYMLIVDKNHITAV